MADGKKYYLKVSVEFGKHGENGELLQENPSGTSWLNLGYGEAVTFEALVLSPMIDGLKANSLKMGVKRAVAQGDMTEQEADVLYATIDKQVAIETSTRKR